MANALGTRLAGMTSPQPILEAAVEELHRAFGYYLCSIVRIRQDGYVESVAGRGEPYAELGGERWYQPRDAGLIGRCLRERRAGDRERRAEPARLPGHAGDRAASRRSWWCRCGSATRSGA